MRRVRDGRLPRPLSWLPEAEVIEDYDSAGRRTGWRLEVGEQTTHESSYDCRDNGLLQSVTLAGAGPGGNQYTVRTHSHLAGSARVARVSGRLGAAGPLHRAALFYNGHLMAGEVAHLAGQHLRLGGSYEHDPLRPAVAAGGAARFGGWAKPAVRV